ncbi:hypothetical protein ACFXO9_03555 [Nocardia tengchongensis]|uniref:hypothetical protein n=1 Tax=Nocardia tengchongensis TaxID=2055889 RepID=UPI0036AEC040
MRMRRDNRALIPAALHDRLTHTHRIEILGWSGPNAALMARIESVQAQVVTYISKLAK